MTDHTTRVTQADREAAKSLLGRDDAGPSWWSIGSGNADNDPMVQAFARHRQAAEAEAGAREAALREALGNPVFVETVDSNAWSLTLHYGVGPDACDQMRSTSDALRALAKPASEGDENAQR